MYGPDDALSPALWHVALAQYPVGSCLTGTVANQARFGVFLDIGLYPVHALLRITDFAETPDVMGFPAVGEMVTGTVLGHNEGSPQLIISQKPFIAPD